jgi:hypothetical protein
MAFYLEFGAGVELEFYTLPGESFGFISSLYAHGYLTFMSMEADRLFRHILPGHQAPSIAICIYSCF